MNIVGDRKFVEVPGKDTHELPPLLIRSAPKIRNVHGILSMANQIIESDDMMPLPAMDGFADELETHRMDLAVNLVDQYLHVVRQWQWGDSILEWIRQCETTFGMRLELRNLLRPDLWPHSNRYGFVKLMRDKDIPCGEVVLEQAVGLRLTFRQPPPISCFSNQFLFYLKSTVTTAACQTWANMSPEPSFDLPPERFSFDVVKMEL